MIQIRNNDCLKQLKNIETNSVDLIVTSPPYNCNIPYRTYQDNLPWNIYLKWCEKWLKQCFRVLKDDGRIAVNVLVEMGIENNSIRVSPMKQFMTIMQKIGFHIMATPVWLDNQKSKLTAWGSWKSASCPYIYNPTQVVIIAYKNSRKKLTKGQNTISKEDFIHACSGIWRIKPDNKSLTIASFPVELPKLAIELLTYKNDLVLDPFNGSGSTAIACLLTQRNYIGIELDEEYCRIAQNRINSFNIQQELF